MRGDPLTLSTLARRFAAAVTDLDRGVPFTLWQMTVRPAAAVGDYLSGRTIRYTSPLRYLIVIAAATTVALLLVEASAEVQVALVESVGEDASPEAVRVTEIVGTLFVDHLNLLILAAVPFVVVASWLCFHSAGRTVAEHLIFSTYTYSHQTLLLTLFVVAGRAGSSDVVNALGMVVATGYWVWAAIRFFGYGWRGGSVRAIGAWVLSTAVYWIVLILAVVAYVGVT